MKYHEKNKIVLLLLKANPNNNKTVFGSFDGLFKIKTIELLLFYMYVLLLYIILPDKTFFS
jgi:hypothetical protein